MKEKIFTNETDEAVLEQINSKIMKHTIQFLNEVNGKLKPFGSGVFAKIYNDYFIITASHVASFFEDHPNEYLRIRVSNKLFIPVLGEVKYSIIEKSEPIDLAYIKLDKQTTFNLSKAYIPVTIEKFRHHNNLLNGTNYCVLGYPAINITKEEKSFNTGATFFLGSPPTNDKPYQLYKFNKRDHMILNVKGKGTNVNTNKRDKIIPQFHGISGCGLWLLLIYDNPATGKTEVDYRLVGIMTEFRTGKYFCVIANRIWLIIEAFKMAEKFTFKEKFIKKGFVA
ncbi:hypothetical protein [Flavobacterium piscisymbiosum]|uniref:Trypsin-like peptidase domain-containing protein n=1 Tax=Flavobacterium piscisymbiosum TaxID=2893753 RepID=A0ABS8MEU3_9FLAO|nr:hypothetical protein [Flavobacterium sp. F-30]MCC9063984.1 hypothetical protein [Flavobacterium sp. F-30]